MSHLRLESTTPTETEKTITELKQENENLKKRIEQLEKKLDPHGLRILLQKVEKEWEEASEEQRRR